MFVDDSATPPTALFSNVDDRESAAQKVFSIPELLEIILIHLSGITRRTIKDLGQHAIPAAMLFVPRLVNTTFRTTIAEILTLQQRMFLFPTPAKKFFATRTRMADWLLKGIGILNNGRVLIEPARNFSTNDAKRRVSRIPKQREVGTAESWRDIKLHLVEGSGPIEFVLRDVILVRSFTSEEEKTLGKVYDALQWLFPFMVRVERGEASKVLEIEYARYDLWH